MFPCSGYFHEFRKELRLDVRNLRLNAPKPEDYRSFIDERNDELLEDDPDDGDTTQENPVFLEKAAHGKMQARAMP